MELGFQLWSAKSEEKEKVLLLHGMGGTGSLWRPIAASLEDHSSILAPDQRGHGKSQSAQPGYTPLEYGQDLVETLEKLHFHPVWAVGHSMGVRSACALAYLKPEWVRGLVLVDLGFSGVAGGGLGDGLASFLKLLPKTFPNRDEARRFMTEHCPDPSIAQYLMAVSVQATNGEITFPFDHGALIQTIDAARDVSLREWVRSFASRGSPVLVLRGARSLVWSHEDFLAEKASFASLPQVEFKEIQAAGHGLPFEQRLAFVAELRHFMSQAGSSN